MKIKDRNIEFNLIIKETKRNIGLRNDNIWCNVDFKCDGDNFNLHFVEDALSLEEIKNNDHNILDFYNGGFKHTCIIKFIKNYFEVKFFVKNRNKYMQIKVTDRDKKVNKITFENDEILNFHLIIWKNYQKI